jgi:hypothetical protein
MAEERDQNLARVLEQIRGFQQRGEELPEPPRRRWQLDVPIWQLALEGVGIFAIAFVSGLGLGVMYQVFTGI